MAEIILKNVDIEFPLYGIEKSFRKSLVNRVGGIIGGEKNSIPKCVRALHNISIELKDGDRLGLVGHNGAGKSTLLRVISGVYSPSRGKIGVKGKVSSLISTSPGMDSEDTGYQNIMTCGLHLGMSKKEILEKIPEIEAFAELGDYLSLPVRVYSTGMQVRLSFAIATSIEPDILVLDEGIGAGDARFAEAAQKRINKLLNKTNILVLATHSNDMIKQYCNKAALLSGGEIIKVGRVEDVLDKYSQINASTSLSDLSSAGLINSTL